MADIVYEKVNEYSSVKISLSSPEDIRSWSYGEVKSLKPSITVPTERKRMVYFVSAYLALSVIGSVSVESIKG